MCCVNLHTRSLVATRVRACVRAGGDVTMTSERRVSVHGDAAVVTWCAVHSADRRSRSVDSGLVTDVDLPQHRAPTATAAVPPAPAPLGSCDSGLPHHVDQSDTELPPSSPPDRPPSNRTASPPPPPAITDNRQSWLLRLFESRLFDMSIAIQYLFNSKESGVQTYIGESLNLYCTVAVY